MVVAFSLTLLSKSAETYHHSCVLVIPSRLLERFPITPPVCQHVLLLDHHLLVVRLRVSMRVMVMELRVRVRVMELS